MAEVVGSSCYAQAELDAGGAIPEEFAPEALLAWSDRLASLGACQALVGLILKLDALSRVRMPGYERALLLHLLEGPIQWALDNRPRLTRQAIQALRRKGWDLTMAQRLVCSAYRNLDLVLRDLDTSAQAPDSDVTETRLWVLEQQFGLLERQISSAVQARLPPPPGTWLELHGRYRYFVAWDAQRGDAERGTDSDIDLRSAYKRILLFGMAADALGGAVDGEGFAARLRGWTLETGLEPPTKLRPGPGAWVVDTALDGPPRDTTEGFAPGGCWVLIPPPGFAAALREGTAGTKPRSA